jgi:peptidoglycan/LPS O-acetylase OafA/YrhL
MQKSSVTVLAEPGDSTEVSPAPVVSGPRSVLLKREMPGLDVLRGIAILSVFCFHGLKWYLPLGAPMVPQVRQLGQVVSFGWLGVNLFFVLSGFLITGVLLDTRTQKNYWSSFYIRRFLRIVPLYVVVLVILKFTLNCTWAYLILCLFYLANFAVPLRVPGPGYGPLWSLAVEEQFYLVWPYLAGRLRLRALAGLCVAGIVLSPALRAISVANSFLLGSPYITTWLISDNLLYGALLAIFLRTAAATEQRVAQLTVLSGGLGAVLLGMGLPFQLLSRNTPGGAAFQPIPFLLLFSSMLLLSLRFGDHPAVYRVLAPVRFFGYISYGFYLFHNLGFFAFDWVTERLRMHLPTATLGFVLFRFVVVGACLTLFCYLSRKYFEGYFLRFKERLAPYSSGASWGAKKIKVPLEPTCG